MKIRLERCVGMCPNRELFDNPWCPGILGTVHPVGSWCEFVHRFVDDRGCTVLVSKGLGDTFMSFRISRSGGLHRVKSPQLPERKTFDKAQADLNKYAIAKQWRAL